MSDPALEPTTEQADACGEAAPTDPLERGCATSTQIPDPFDEGEIDPESFTYEPKSDQFNPRKDKEVSRTDARAIEPSSSSELTSTTETATIESASSGTI